MPVFDCPSCQTKLQALEEHVGSTIQCPKCQQLTRVPGQSTEAISTVPMPASAPPAPHNPTAVTTPDQVGAPAKGRDRRDDDDRRRPRELPPVKSGMSVLAILLIVFGIGGCVVVPISIALLVPAVQKVREAAARTQKTNNMKQIGLACHIHHDMTKMFPSPKAGELSWRVTILPYIEQAHLLNQIDPMAKWDHPRNQQFLSQRPLVYDSELQPDADRTQTRYQYFTGPNTMFADPETRVKMAMITDGTSNTFLFAEAAASVPWTKPADMVLQPNAALPLPADRFLACFADGSVRTMDRRRVNDAVLRLLIDPQDGQAVLFNFD